MHYPPTAMLTQVSCSAGRRFPHGPNFAPVIAEAGYITLVLPSSSPANAMLSFDQKLRLWRDILT
jgi:G:T/U-mismatch repair DNA glycosylase